MQFKDGKIILDKRLNDLDRFVTDFVNVVDNFTNYVLISGYVAILFGRSRGTEDVDMVIEEMNKEETNKLVESLKKKGYWCINSDNPYNMLSDELSVRFAEKGKVLPNFEVRFALDEFEKISLSERLKVEIGNNKLFVSPLELQIAYKLYLGSQKDFEDALHLFELFKEKLNIKKLEEFCKRLEVNLDELRKA